MIKAIPLEIALVRFVLGEQLVARLFVRNLFRGSVTAWYEILPDIVVEGEIENRAVHVEQ